MIVFELFKTDVYYVKELCGVVYKGNSMAERKRTMDAPMTPEVPKATEPARALPKPEPAPASLTVDELLNALSQRFSEYDNSDALANAYHALETLRSAWDVLNMNQKVQHADE